MPARPPPSKPTLNPQAAANLVIFFCLLIIVVWAFAQTQYVSFGTEIADFKTVLDAGVNTFKAMIEGFDLDELRTSDEVLGLIIYVLFLFIGLFVMLNMFLAIIM